MIFFQLKSDHIININNFQPLIHGKYNLIILFNRKIATESMIYQREVALANLAKQEINVRKGNEEIPSDSTDEDDTFLQSQQRISLGTQMKERIQGKLGSSSNDPEPGPSGNS